MSPSWHNVPQLLPHELRVALGEVEEHVSFWPTRTEDVHVEITLARRVPDTASSSVLPSASCTPGSHSRLCQQDVSDTANLTLPIALGVTLPVVAAAVVLFFLHRRIKRKQRIEDDLDRQNSLDFGLGEHLVPPKSRKGKAEPEMSSREESFEKGARSRGLSLDLGNPYVLPGDFTNLADTRGSLHSLTRSQHDSEGPYQAIGFMKSSESLGLHPASVYSRSGLKRDTASVMSASSQSTTQTGLLRNAQHPSSASPPSGSVINTPMSTSPEDASPITMPDPVFVASRKAVAAVIPEIVVPAPAEVSTRFIREGNDQQGAFVPPRAASKPPTQPMKAATQLSKPSTQTPSASTMNISTHLSKPAAPTPAPSTQQRGSAAPSTPVKTAPIDTGLTPIPSTSQRLNTNTRSPGWIPSSPMAAYDDSVTYADVLGIVQKESRSPNSERQMQFPPMPTIPEPKVVTGLGVQGLQFGTQRYSAGQRPLPPHNPADNPEQRANRIRSFYREYFDDSKGRYSSYGREGNENYQNYEGYGQEYLDGAAIYDPETGGFIVAGAPYQEPITRRAMTPPPRAPPKFRNSPGPSGRRSNASATPQQWSPRTQSSASGRPHTSASRGRPQKRAPAPGPLTTLGTPHDLKSDNAILSPTDFAPPMTWKDRQAGRSTSPRVTPQPWVSPRVRAFSPLATSFDDLAMLPSPHALRKSASFTALDFAMPPRFRNENGSSDAGSVRSGRSNVSAQQIANIRAGAYRVSRIPKEFVGTKDDFAVALRPSWKQRDEVFGQ